MLHRDGVPLPWLRLCRDGCWAELDEDDAVEEGDDGDCSPCCTVCCRRCSGRCRTVVVRFAPRRDNDPAALSAGSASSEGVLSLRARRACDRRDAAVAASAGLAGCELATALLRDSLRARLLRAASGSAPSRISNDLDRVTPPLAPAAAPSPVVFGLLPPPDDVVRLLRLRPRPSPPPDDVCDASRWCRLFRWWRRRPSDAPPWALEDADDFDDDEASETTDDERRGARDDCCGLFLLRLRRPDEALLLLLRLLRSPLSPSAGASDDDDSDKASLAEISRRLRDAR